MNNTVVKQSALTLAEYTLPGGQILTYDTVKNYICPIATDQEILFFIELCKAQKLNPFVKDAYLVKYGNQPAQIIVGKDVFIKRANENPNFNGMKCGVVVIDKKGEIEEREGALKLPGEQLIGGWCEVYLKDKDYPTKSLVSFEEYAQKTKEGKINSMWSNKSATMIRKVAQSQALREAFPNELRGLYQQEEMGIGGSLSEREIKVGYASDEQKKQILAMASVKGLYDFNSKSDVKKLEYFCDSNGYNLKELKFEEVQEVLDLLTKYEPKDTENIVQDVEFQEVEDDKVHQTTFEEVK